MADNEKKIVAEWEKELGQFLNGDVAGNKQVTQDEFIELTQEQGFIGVNYELRVEWLKENGYDVTRENLTNSDLSVRRDNNDEQ